MRLSIKRIFAAVRRGLRRSPRAVGRLALAGLLAVALAGCASLNPVNWFSGSKAPKPAPLVQIVNPQPVRTLWQVRVGTADRYTLTPAAVDGAVYAAAYDGTVLRIDADSGKEVWRVDVGDGVSGGVGADGDLVVVGTKEGEVIALDANGRIMWRARVSSEVLAAPQVADGKVVVRSSDSRIFALDARDGRRLWVYQRAAPALSVRNVGAVVVRGGFVFAGFPGGKLAAIALDNGGLRWEGTVALPRGTTELERVTDVTGAPWIGDGEACAVAYHGRAVCFSLTNGSQIWTREISSSAGLAVDARRVYVSEDDGAVTALDRSSGASVWRQGHLANRYLSAPLVSGSEVVVGDVEGFVHLLAGDDGSFVARVATDGSPVRATPVPSGEGFLVQTVKGGLYLLKAE